MLENFGLHVEAPLVETLGLEVLLVAILDLEVLDGAFVPQMVLVLLRNLDDQDPYAAEGVWHPRDYLYLTRITAALTMMMMAVALQLKEFPPVAWEMPLVEEHTLEMSDRIALVVSSLLLPLLQALLVFHSQPCDQPERCCLLVSAL